MNIETIKKSSEVGLCAIIVSINGWLSLLIMVYVISMLLDWLTGSALAIKNKEWSSSKSRLGLWHKCGSIIAVAVSALTDILLRIIVNNIVNFQLPFEYNTLICPMVMIWYIVSELGSCLENAANMGAPIPKFLQDILEKAASNVRFDNKNQNS